MVHVSHITGSTMHTWPAQVTHWVSRCYLCCTALQPPAALPAVFAGRRQWHHGNPALLRLPPHLSAAVPHVGAVETARRAGLQAL